ncbi:hypothetical protein NW757_014428, partial [Fusarium falciforme]
SSEPSPSSTVNRLAYRRIDIDAVILILILYSALKLLRDQPSDSSSHLDRDRPVSSHPNPDPRACLHHSRQLSAEPVGIPHPRAAISPHEFQLLSARLG